MSAQPEPSLPLAPPTVAHTPQAVPMPEPNVPPAQLTPIARPTPTPLPTPGEYRLIGEGKPVAAVEIIGHPVHERGAEQVHALHLSEVITYRDGSQDIVGYFPEGKGVAHNGDPLYVETKLDGQSKAAYIAEGRAHYRHEIEQTAHQSLNQFVAAQEQGWKAYNGSRQPGLYDFAGHELHNSNGAIVASVEYAGRPDVAARLRQDLEPPARIEALERRGLSADGASMALSAERSLANEPVAPGASHNFTHAQIVGQATSAPSNVVDRLMGRQRDGAREAGLQLIRNGLDRLTSGRAHDLLDTAPLRDAHSFSVLRGDKNGVQSIEQKSDQFQQSGRILSADSDRVVQSIRGNETFTYRTDDLLARAHDPKGTLQILESAAQQHENMSMQLGRNGLSLENMHNSRAHELNR